MRRRIQAAAEGRHRIMALKVSTAAVDTAARQIQDRNNKIKTDFSAVEAAMSALNQNWDGNASDRAVSGFQNIKREYCDRRYQVLKDFTAFMSNQVKESYETMEGALSSAASAFK